ncbi:MAG: alpha/beta fold hydrolase [Rhodobacteraceae bacterium]|nr:alpha/beta fold hydrolase [Paracoccaceae bacterium]
MMSRTLRLSDGLSVGLIEVGPKDRAGEPLVLIHGVGLNSRAWAPQIAGLAATHRVFAIDMPGHGGSSPLPAGARLPDFVTWAARAILALNAGAVNVAGHSMGALIATGLAADYPELIRRVAVLNAVHRRTPEARAAVLSRAMAMAEGRFDAEAPLDRWFTRGAEDAAPRAQVARWLKEVNPQGYAAAYRAFAEGDDVYADRWEAICCPALVLTADGDPNSTPEMTRLMAATAPCGRAVVIEGHRHMVNLTAPDRVTAALRDWLNTPIMVETEGLRA